MPRLLGNVLAESFAEAKARAIALFGHDVEVYLPPARVRRGMTA